MQLSVIGTALANLFMATVISFSFMVLSDGGIETYFRCLIIVVVGLYSYDIHVLNKKIVSLGGS